MSWHPGGPVGDPHSGPGYSGRNRQPSKEGPSGVQRSTAAQLNESEPLFNTYEHLSGLPRGDAALTMLRKVASVVKPIMRKHAWRVQVLAEFLPKEQNLLGLNINKGYKICIRLRYHNNPDLFLPFEEVCDTMLHELCHNVWGDHDSNFHKLWDQLRDEHEALVLKGYTGEGFLSAGQRLGGAGGNRMLPLHEARRIARESAEKRKAQGKLAQGSGQKLGGTPLHLQGRDVRQIIADQVTRRNTINKGCASGRQDADKLSQDSANATFKTKAEEDDANNRAISQALIELMEEEEDQKLGSTRQASSSKSSGLAWSPEHGLYNAGMSMPNSKSQQQHHHPSEEEQLKWAMQESLQSAGETGPARPILPPATSSGLERTIPAPPVPYDSKPNLQAGKKLSNLSGTHQTNLSAPSIKHEMIKQEGIEMEDEQFIDLTAISESEDAVSGNQWACEICTCINPLQYLACDACGVERSQSVSARVKQHAEQASPAMTDNVSLKKRRREIPPPTQHASLGWTCKNCSAFMEHKWWTCSACGEMKTSS